MINIRQTRDKVTRFLSEDVWQMEPANRGRRILFGAARFFTMVYRGFNRDHCFLRATALSYTTVFSIVPVTAVAFAFLGALAPFQAYQEQVMDFVFDQFIPPSITEEDETARADITEQIRQFIAEKQELLRERSTGIGVIGAGFLIFSLVSLMVTIEKSFNAIWGVQRGRRYVTRLIYYWFLTFVPVLMVISLGIATALTSSEAALWLQRQPFIRDILASRAMALAIRHGVTIFLTWVAFSALYTFMPNTRVRALPAIKGGLWAAVLFEATKTFSVLLLSGKAVHLGVLYGALAAVPLFLFWVYLIWLIVLFGAEITFASQNIKTYAREQRVEDVSHATRELIALRIYALSAYRFDHGEPALTNSEISDWFHVPIRLVNEICSRLAEAGLMTESHNEDLVFQPARSLETVTVKDVIDCLRRGKDRELHGRFKPEDSAIVDVFDRGEAAADEVYGSTSFKEISQMIDRHNPETDGRSV